DAGAGPTILSTLLHFKVVARTAGAVLGAEWLYDVGQERVDLLRRAAHERLRVDGRQDVDACESAIPLPPVDQVVWLPLPFDRLVLFLSVSPASLVQARAITPGGVRLHADIFGHHAGELFGQVVWNDLAINDHAATHGVVDRQDRVARYEALGEGGAADGA